MLFRKIESGGDLTLCHAMAHQTRIAASTQRQRECIEQNRFAGAGLARQHRKACRKFNIEPFDQDDVADR